MELFKIRYSKKRSFLLEKPKPISLTDYDLHLPGHENFPYYSCLSTYRGTSQPTGNGASTMTATIGPGTFSTINKLSWMKQHRKM